MSILSLLLLFIILSLQWKPLTSRTWIKAGYWYTGSEYPIPNINTALFTHLICAFAYINSSTHDLVLLTSDEPYVSMFASTVKNSNPSVKPLLSIRPRNEYHGNDENSSNFFIMAENPAYRKSFVESSIKMARHYGFEGIDLYATTLLSHYLPELDSVSYPVDSVRKKIDWVHVRSYDYHTPMTIDNFTAAHAALYDPSSPVNTDYGINLWIKRGLPASQLVLGLAYHGYAWTLADPKNDGIGAPAKGMVITKDGSMSYEYIKKYLRSYRVNSEYNSTYVMNYCAIGSFGIVFDDVEAIRNKVAYGKKKGLLGYSVWQVPNDDNWKLSIAAGKNLPQ
ncbi:putative chitinase [Helianthus anomalus]